MRCSEEVPPNENEARQELVDLRGERDRAQVLKAALILRWPRVIPANLPPSTCPGFFWDMEKSLNRKQNGS
jgi:hypothetical protein